MEVEFELTQEDLIAFQRYHQKHPPFRPRRRVGPPSPAAFVVAAAFGVVAYCRVYLHHPLVDRLFDQWLPQLSAALIGGAVFLTVCLLYLKWTADSRMRKALKESGDADKAWLGWRRVALAPDGFHVTSRVVSVITRWEGIKKVTATDEHVFIYDTANSAYAVPRHAFADGKAFDAFVEEARRYRNAAMTGVTVPWAADEAGRRECSGPGGLQTSASLTPPQGIVSDG